MERKTTDVELVQELDERNIDGKYNAIIERAKNKGYHDFKFDLDERYNDCVCPKMQLVEDLAKFPELDSVRKEVMNGAYDESPDEEDKKRMRGELGNDALVDALGL